MVNAAAERTPGGKTSIAKGYLVDSVHGWRGGILCGPWPAEELNIGRSDIEAQRARTAMGDGRQHIDDLNPSTEDDEGASWCRPVGHHMAIPKMRCGRVQGSDSKWAPFSRLP